MIVSGSEFDCKTHVKFQKPKPNQNGAGKNVGITNAQSNKALVLSTPLLLTWGVNEWKDDSTGRVSYDMALQFPSEEYSSRATTEFLNAMKAHEQNIKDAAVTHSKEWFGKATMSPEVVDALFSPMLRYPKNPETGEADTTRAPTLKIKIPYWQDEFNTEVYDMNMNPLYPCSDSSVTPQTLIQKASNVAVIIQSSGLWFAGGKFGTNWKLVQCVVKPKATLKGKCHISLAPEEREKLAQQKDASDDDEPENVTTQVNDSDDEEESNQDKVEEVEQEQEPAPEPKKEAGCKEKEGCC